MSNQIDITGGARVRNLNGVITGSTGVLSSLPINGANGIPQLDSSGKILVSQLPNSVMEFLGTWNAATNTPTLANGTGNAGDVYLCTVAGTVDFGAGPITFQDGDYVVYSGSTWERSSGAMGTVTSVGASITGNSIGITGSPVTTSGTLAFAFAGTSGQYINGAGNLVTFPSLTGYVPYSGATGNVDLGEWGIKAGYYGFDLTPTGTPTSVGIMYWDAFYRTPSIITGTGATTLQVGQEQVTLVHNNTGATLTDGQVVYVTGSTGELPSVALATNATEAASSVTFGVVTESIAHGSDGFVTTSGMIHGLNTLAFNEGDALWLGATAGTFTNVKPTAPANSVLIGYVIKKAGGNGSIFVKIQNGSELTELHDVLISGVTNNQGLFWDSATSLWKNKSISTALGYTPADDSLVVHKSGNETIAGQKTFSDQATFTGTSIFNNQATFNDIAKINAEIKWIKNPAIQTASAGYLTTYATSGMGLSFFDGDSGNESKFIFNSGANYNYTFPAANGTIALTSNLSSYVPYTGATTNVNLGTNSLYSQSIINKANINIEGSISGASTLAGSLAIKTSTSGYTWGGVGYVSLSSYAAKSLSLIVDDGGSGAYVANLSGASLTASRDYTLPNASGTIALVGGAGVGTVTSVAALTIGTSGTDLSSTVANSTTTPVITLNVPTASATNRGALSSTDWTTFNNKQNALTNPVTGTGTTNYLPKFTGTSTIGNSIISESGSTISIAGGLTASGIIATSGTGLNSSVRIANTTASTGIDWHLYSLNNGNFGLYNNTAGAYAYQVTASGNLGLGVTPSAWISGYNAIQIGNGANFTGYLFNRWDEQEFGLVANGYRSTSGSWLYYKTGFSTRYLQDDGVHSWSTAPSGTAGNAITFTQAMTLTSGGNLLVGTTTDAGYKLDVNGTFRAVSGASPSVFNTATGQGIAIENSGASNKRYRLNVDGTSFLITEAGVGTPLTIASGGAATFSSSVTAGSNFKIESNGDAYQLTTGGAALWSATANVNYPTYGFYGDTGLGMYRPATDALGFVTGDTERMRITSAGELQVSTANVRTYRNVSSSTYPLDANSFAGYIAMNSANVNGSLAGYAMYADSSYNAATGIFATRTSASTADMVFYTGSNFATERMRITSGGVAQIANASGTQGTLVGSERLNVNGGIYAYNGITSAGILTGQGVYVGTSTPSDASLRVELTSGYAIKVTRTGLDRFWVDSDGAGFLQAAAWTYGSDLRLKENIKDVVNGIDTILKLKPKHFDYIDGVKNNLGFIAQDVKNIIPQAVSNISKDSDLLGLKTDFIVPYLVKAIQEQQAQINELKNK